MSKREYHQLCPVAYTLDLMCERWMLLIVRDLSLGPLRFTDLLERLPGIGRALLADRLQQLVEGGEIEKTELPPPAASAVYKLTEKSNKYLELLELLAQWGMRHLFDPISSEGHFEPDMAPLALLMSYCPESASGVNLTIEFLIDEKLSHIDIQEGYPIARRGPAAHADARLAGDTATLLQLRKGQLTGTQAIESGRLRIEGDFDTAVRFFALVGLAE